MSRHRASERFSLAYALIAVLSILLLAAWDRANASMSSSRSSVGSLGSSSSRNSRSSSARSSRNSSDSEDDSDFGDSGDSRDRSRSSRSRNSTGSDRRRSSSRSSSSSRGGRSVSSGRSSSKPEAPALVFGPKFEHDGVRPHGTLISSTQFADLPGRHDSVQIGSSTYYKAGNSWYQRIDHEGWTCYAEIYPPAGARVASLPAEYVTLGSGDKTFYATDTAVYVREPGAGYVVVEPALGTRVDRLPADAKKGIPVVVNGTTYYRYLRLFYRAENGPSGETYVVTPSPFLSESSASQNSVKPDASGSANPGSVGAEMAFRATSAAEGGAWETSSAPPGSPRATFLSPSAEPSVPAAP